MKDKRQDSKKGILFLLGIAGLVTAGLTWLCFWKRQHGGI